MYPQVLGRNGKIDVKETLLTRDEIENAVVSAIKEASFKKWYEETYANKHDGAFKSVEVQKNFDAGFDAATNFYRKKLQKINILDDIPLSK